MSDGSEFQVCGAETENARRANSVRVLAADSSRASEDRRGRTGTAGWIRSCKYSPQYRVSSSTVTVVGPYQLPIILRSEMNTLMSPKILAC